MRNHEILQQLEEDDPIKFTYQASHHCGWKGEKHEALPQPGEKTPSSEVSLEARIEAACDLFTHIRDCEKAFAWERYIDPVTAFASPNIRVEKEFF